MQIDGSCHCGRITYQAEVDPERVSICHCTDCQTLTGSPFRVTVICTADDVRLTAGSPRRYTKLGDNGRPRHQHFCSDCGTPLFSSGEGDGGDWGIRWGSIRQRDRLPPRRQIWCGSAVGWLDQITRLPGRPGD
ncbi:GFA family protein [Bradyrhizobium ontarionense]|uniref:GFA family protein n=1 Tax=Bradyrhizobium ontarionense TaxID=2898149 RepID=A0ABY3RF36_9BRAD|nr:GFA family protein [Bradyrhizobium sp. A19]UFZ06065.1 GFA family protein [Bradyrhizobium sp. A19]